MIYFQRNNIDIAFIEAGIGGSLDTTKAIEGDYGVVTSIGLDHEKILGTTLDEIAKNKNGIRNEKMKFYVPSNIGETKDVFTKGNYKVINNEATDYKKANIKLAMGILEDFCIKSVIKEIKGRSEVRTVNGKNAIIDVAHNIDGIKASLNFLKDDINFDVVILTIQKSKNIKGLKELFTDKEVKVYQPDETYYGKE